jgi:hypothetical protein
VTFPEQPQGQQLPVCDNGHPMTSVDSSCPLCGAGRAAGGTTSAFPGAQATPQQGVPAAPPAPGGFYQQPGEYGGGQAGGFQGGAPGYQAQPAPGGYQAQPAPGYGWQQPQSYIPAAKTNVLAIVSLVAGILWVFWLGSIVAIICGVIALAQTRARRENGRGIAIAGIILGAVGIVTLLATIALVAIGAHSTSVNSN